MLQQFALWILRAAPFPSTNTFVKPSNFSSRSRSVAKLRSVNFRNRKNSRGTKLLSTSSDIQNLNNKISPSDTLNNISQKKSNIVDKMKGRRVGSSNESLVECAARLRSGDLVAFPTETVYVGLVYTIL